MEARSSVWLVLVAIGLVLSVSLVAQPLVGLGKTGRGAEPAFHRTERRRERDWRTILHSHSVSPSRLSPPLASERPDGGPVGGKIGPGAETAGRPVLASLKEGCGKYLILPCYLANILYSLVLPCYLPCTPLLSPSLSYTPLRIK